MFTFTLPGHGLAGRARLYEFVRCGIFWLCVLLAAYWAADRKPPIVLLATQQPAVGKRGETAHLNLQVARAIGRGCAVSYHRYLYDADGYRFDLAGRSSHMNAAAIEAMERAAAGRLLLSVPIPARAAPGRARFVTSLQYVCNPLHHVWPIPVLLEVPIDIT